jgi:hypothetical protein
MAYIPVPPPYKHTSATGKALHQSAAPGARCGWRSIPNTLPTPDQIEAYFTPFTPKRRVKLDRKVEYQNWYELISRTQGAFAAGDLSLGAVDRVPAAVLKALVDTGRLLRTQTHARQPYKYERTPAFDSWWHDTKNGVFNAEELPEFNVQNEEQKRPGRQHGARVQTTQNPQSARPKRIRTRVKTTTIKDDK